MREVLKTILGNTPAQAAMYGVHSLSISNRYVAGSTGEPGAAGGFGFATFLKIESQSVSSATREIYSNDISATSGYALRTLTTNATLSWTAVNAALANVTSSAYTIASGDVGKWMHVCGVYDLTGTKLRLYVAGVQVGSGTTMVGYTPATAALQIGRRANNTLGADNIGWSGAVTFTGIPTVTDIAAHYTAAKYERKLGVMGGTGVTMTHRHSVRSDGGDVGLQTTILDKVGSDNLTSSGSPTWFRDAAPTFV